MSTITCPAAEIARSTAATYDVPFGKSRSSEVCEMNTRHRAPSPRPAEPANRITPIGKSMQPPRSSMAKAQRFSSC